MLVVVIIVGLLYALPNLYGEDPAVQITGARGVAASEQTLIRSRKRYKKKKLPLSLWHWKGRNSCSLRHHRHAAPRT